MLTDMVGYSSMTERDEKKALSILGEHRELLTAVFPEYGGVVVKTMGDGFLVEFASAVEAVHCAIEVQNQMKKFNERRGKGESIMIRIAIHVGDIVHSAGDILGDAVNVAARVESLAEPGEIRVTRQVVDQVRGKVACEFLSLGLHDLKNIQNPVELYRIVPSATSYFGQAVLDSRRLAVLPLANMSSDPNDGYFADGMTEELISTISRIGELSVISRTSVMKYKDAGLSIGKIGQELAAGSILEGSVRKAGNRVRITAQLIDAASDRHLWSQSYDRDLTDVFAVQADIAEQVAEALKIQLLSKERRSIEKKATISPEAYTLYLKGRYYWNERTEAAVRRAAKYFDEAIEADPNFAMAYSGLADAYLIMSDYAWMDSDDAGPLALRYARRALEIDDTLAEAHASLGLAPLNHSWDFGSAETELKRAIELRPNYASAYHWYGILLSFLNRFQEALEMLKRAVELDPYSRVLNMSAGGTQYYLRQYDRAIELLDRVIDSNPDFPAPHYWKSFVYVELGDFDRAIAAGRRAAELDNQSAGMRLNLAWVYAVAGDAQSATKIMKEVISEDKGLLSPATIAMVKYELGQKDEAFDLLQKACDIKDTSLLYLRGSPAFKKYVSDPRWAEIEKKMKLPNS